MTSADAQARRQLIAWAGEIGLTAAVDAIGNLFLRRAGQRDDLPPVMTGSHLDTQPTGGKFDGAFGVLAGLEALTALDQANMITARPIELVVWNNEEGCRFPPTTMGSSVFTGHLPLEQALDVCDSRGVRVVDALDAMNRETGVACSRTLGGEIFAYLEAHIEQGPCLEDSGVPLGIVTEIQGLRWFEVEVRGSEAHAGTTPRNRRRDALQAAINMIHELLLRCSDHDDVLRFTVGRFVVSPNVPNTVPGTARFTIDLRHPNADTLQYYGDLIAPVCRERADGCTVTVYEQPASQPTRFDADIQKLLCDCADDCGVRYQRLPSGATHDAKWLSLIAPSGMLFAPCAEGLSHNVNESAHPDDLARVTCVLTEAISRLANRI